MSLTESGGFCCDLRMVGILPGNRIPGLIGVSVEPQAEAYRLICEFAGSSFSEMAVYQGTRCYSDEYKPEACRRPVSVRGRLSGI